MIPIEQVALTNRLDVLKKERERIESLRASLNKQVLSTMIGKTKPEYNKEYLDKNREIIHQKQRKYTLKNKEQKQLYDKEYRERNKEKKKENDQDVYSSLSIAILYECN